MYKMYSLNLFKNFEYSFTKEKQICNYAQIGNIDHYSLQNIFIISINIKSLNPSTYLQRYSFLYWMVLEKSELSNFRCFLT